MTTAAARTPESAAARRDGRRGALLALPAVAWTVAFFVLPTGLVGLWSFFRREDGALVTEPGLDNWRRLLDNDSFRTAAWNSLTLTLTVTALSVLLAWPLAWAIARRVPARLQRLVLLLAVLPFWTSYVVRSYAWLLVLAPDGVINATLLATGLIDAPLELSFNRGATIAGFVHFFTMLCTLTIWASLVRIDPKLERAAADLGASRWQVFTRVTLPLSMPGVAAGAFLTFVVAIGDYVTPQILGGSTELLLPQVILLQIQRRADIPMAATLSMLLLACVVVAWLAVHKWLIARPR